MGFGGRERKEVIQRILYGVVGGAELVVVVWVIENDGPVECLGTTILRLPVIRIIVVYDIGVIVIVFVNDEVVLPVDRGVLIVIVAAFRVLRIIGVNRRRSIGRRNYDRHRVRVAFHGYGLVVSNNQLDTVGVVSVRHAELMGVYQISYVLTDKPFHLGDAAHIHCTAPFRTSTGPRDP